MAHHHHTLTLSLLFLLCWVIASVGTEVITTETRETAWGSCTVPTVLGVECLESDLLACTLIQEDLQESQFTFVTGGVCEKRGACSDFSSLCVMSSEVLCGVLNSLIAQDAIYDTEKDCYEIIGRKYSIDGAIQLEPCSPTAPPEYASVVTCDADGDYSFNADVSFDSILGVLANEILTISHVVNSPALSVAGKVITTAKGSLKIAHESKITTGSMDIEGGSEFVGEKLSSTRGGSVLVKDSGRVEMSGGVTLHDSNMDVVGLEAKVKATRGLSVRNSKMNISKGSLNVGNGLSLKRDDNFEGEDDPIGLVVTDSDVVFDGASVEIDGSSSFSDSEVIIKDPRSHSFNAGNMQVSNTDVVIVMTSEEYKELKEEEFEIEIATFDSRSGEDFEIELEVDGCRGDASPTYTQSALMVSLDFHADCYDSDFISSESARTQSTAAVAVLVPLLILTVFAGLYFFTVHILRKKYAYERVDTGRIGAHNRPEYHGVREFLGWHYVQEWLGQQVANVYNERFTTRDSLDEALIA